MSKTLFPEIDPFNTGFLKVSDIHNIYFEEVGNPQGKPVVFIHGGPGGGITPDYRRFFNPSKWRVILFDQRGCGKSEPFAELKENTTASDVEGWDSLAHATFIIHLEENLQITFDLNDLMKMDNMGELSNIVDEKLK